jgi:hypothetical protein
VLQVADTGVGIPEKDRPHIFERFYRVDQARSRDKGGSGLGLAITRWVIEAHGGTISFTSEEGREPPSRSASRRRRRRRRNNRPVDGSHGIVRSKLHLLMGIGAVVGPLVFVWTLCRSGESHLPSRPSSASRERPAAVAAPEPPATRERLTLTGEVVDASGRSVADALVTLVDPEGRGDVLAPGRSREFKDRQTRTDEAGRYRFDDLTPGRRSLVARAGERPPAWTEPFQLDRNLHRTLTLPSPVRLAGLTHPGAKLSFSCRIPGIPTSGRDPFVRTTAADETGG